jgi:hypothetical protein
MLLDWYVRIKRIDEWPEATATALSAELIEGQYGPDGKLPDNKKIAFIYPDGSGRAHSGEITPTEEADLFFIDAGDTFAVKFNPRKPENYFVTGAHSVTSWTVATFIFFAVLAAGIIKLILLISRLTHN